jgi:uncharacterized protein (DUF3820 family)
VKINFGKFKGMELSDIPKEDKGLSYLKWLLDTGKNPTDGNQKSAITKAMINEIEQILNSYNSNKVIDKSSQEDTHKKNSSGAVALKDLIDALQLEIIIAKRNFENETGTPYEDTWGGIVEGLETAKKVIEVTWNKTN